MKFLAISGSGRKASTNTAMLRAVAEIASPDHQLTVFDGVSDLPVFSPDLESSPLPDPVRRFVAMIEQSQGVIVSSPEYVRAIPGGLKNAIDWLVSREEIALKPIAMMHASHRGNDVLRQLRLVLSTVSHQFNEDLFLRFELLKHTPEEISHLLNRPSNRAAVADYLRRFALYCQR